MFDNKDGLGTPLGPREPGFKGKRFTPVFLPTRVEEKKVEELVPGLSFPVTLQVVGVTRGPQWCESCKNLAGEKNTMCPRCQSPYLVSYRQNLLKQIQELRLGIVKLVAEPENAFDSRAVAVYVRWPDGGQKQVGYIPAKRDRGGELSTLIASDIFDSVQSGFQYYCDARVVGGPQEGKSDISYGFRLTIRDKPPTE